LFNPPSKAFAIMTASLQTAGGPGVPDTSLDPERRNAVITACVVGGFGCAGVAVPIVASLGPSEREKAAGGPVEVDIASIATGQMQVVEW
jgi:ubiquinol-cytochrome c reductase iron-sulfur subunit